MIDPKELLNIVLDEIEAGHNKDETFASICAQFGLPLPSTKSVDQWFQELSLNGSLSYPNKEPQLSYYYIRLEIIKQFQQAHTEIASWKRNRAYGFKFLDSRYSVAINDVDTKTRSLILFDNFWEECREAPIDFEFPTKRTFRGLEIIDKNRLLLIDEVRGAKCSVYLLSTNFKQMKFSVLDTTIFDGIYVRTVFDSEHRERFLMLGWSADFSKEYIRKGDILASKLNFNAQLLKLQIKNVDTFCIKFTGNKIYAFTPANTHDERRILFRELSINFNTGLVCHNTSFRVKKKRSIKTSALFADTYFWSGDKCFIVKRAPNGVWSTVYLFDSRRLKRLGNYGISTATDSFVDSNEILTLNASHHDSSWNRIHRIALRQPDTLPNLALFTIVRQRWNLDDLKLLPYKAEPFYFE